MNRRLCILGLLLAGIGVFGLGGCVNRLADNLTDSILNQPDPGIVKEGTPSFLMVVDGLIAGDPKDAGLLRGGASLYVLYTAMFVDDPVRAGHLSGRARDYGQRALCASRDSACGLAERSFPEFKKGLEELERRDVPAVYAWTISWLAWLKSHSSEWDALADLPKVEAALEKLIELDEGYEHGSAHFYLGVLKTVRPEALGGDPETGRRHFERAIALCRGQDLSFKVEFARYYARLRYDRTLHDQLLHEVLAANAEVPGLVLVNNLARQQAKILLESAEEYF